MHVVTNNARKHRGADGPSSGSIKSRGSRLLLSQAFSFREEKKRLAMRPFLDENLGHERI
jgi:hypothetical protein